MSESESADLFKMSEENLRRMINSHLGDAHLGILIYQNELMRRLLEKLVKLEQEE